MYIKYLSIGFLLFTSCQYLKPTDNRFLQDYNKKVNGEVTRYIKGKKVSVLSKKVWMRETFSKDFTRPSILQSIKPVLTKEDLLVQGNKVNGVSVYTSKQGKRKWLFPIKGGVAGDILVSGEFVFFGGSDGFLYALYLKTGRVLWKYYTGLTGISAPVVRGSNLYFASASKIYCLNIKTGENIWTYSTQIKPTEFTVEGVAAPLIGNKFIYFKVSDGSLIALDFKGRLKWKHTLSNSGSRFTTAFSSPVMGKVCLYSSSLESGVYCLNKKTGKVIWKTDVGSYGDLLLDGSRLFYSTHDGKVLALDQKSGKQIWSHDVPESIATSPVLYKDILIYGEYAGVLRFISRSTGEELHSFPFGNGMSAPPVLSEATSELYFISNAGWLYKMRLKM